MDQQPAAKNAGRSKKFFLGAAILAVSGLICKVIGAFYRIPLQNNILGLDGMSLYQLNKLYDAFSDELAKSGYGCMLYGSKKYLEKAWTKTDTRPVWLAHYTEKTDYEGPFMLWQASCTGRIPGIEGNVDMDILYNKN